MIWEACGRDLLAAPLGWFLLHLCIGDTWNTINNVEARRGTSAAFVLLVLASVYNAAYQYFQVSSPGTKQRRSASSDTCVWKHFRTWLFFSCRLCRCQALLALSLRRRVSGSALPRC